MRRGAWLLVVLSACAAPEGSDVNSGAGSADVLSSTLDVRVVGDSVRFVLHVTNVTDDVVQLEFATSQREEFEVSRADGTVVWRSSDDMMFAQVMGTWEMAAGASSRYEATWFAPRLAGEYVATGRLTSQNHPVELRTTFQLPDS